MPGIANVKNAVWSILLFFITKLHNKGNTDSRLRPIAQFTTLGSYAELNLVEIDAVVFGYYTLSSRCLEIHTGHHMAHYVNR